MTLSQMRSKVRFLTKRQSSSLSDDEIKDWLNWAQRWLAEIFDFREMETIDTTLKCSTDTNKVAIPSSWKKIKTIVCEDGNNSKLLERRNSWDFDFKHPYFTLSQRPSLYVFFGNYIELYPNPNDTYTLRCRVLKYPDDLSADDDTSSLNKDMLLVALASYWILIGLRDLEGAKLLDAKWITPLLASYQEFVDDRFKGMVIQPSFQPNKAGQKAYYNPF